MLKIRSKTSSFFFLFMVENLGYHYQTLNPKRACVSLSLSVFVVTPLIPPKGSLFVAALLSRDKKKMPPPSASLTAGEKGGGAAAAAACGAVGSSAAERKHNSSLGYRPESILDFPSHLFHECFRKGFVLELDRLCGLAWEISRMDEDDEAERKEEVSWERKIEALHLRWNKFADLYSEHTKCEDATMFPELNVRVANVTKSYELEHEAENGCSKK